MRYKVREFLGSASFLWWCVLWILIGFMIGIFFSGCAIAHERPAIGPAPACPHGQCPDFEPVSECWEFPQYTRGYCADTEAVYLAVSERLGCCGETYVCLRPLPAGRGVSQVAAAFESAQTCEELIALMDPWR
jgi:hypothetical protein